MIPALTASAERKATLGTWTTLVRGAAAGFYIAFGGMLCTLIKASGGSPLLAGVAFSLGLILVVLTGAELFTGNVLVFAVGQMNPLRNWTLVYLGNLVGSLTAVALMTQAAPPEAYAEMAAKIAEAKLSLPFVEALSRGILCNILVCLAIAMAAKAETTEGKILAIVPPIAAFVALGFEHSVANMYLLAWAPEVTLVGMLSSGAALLGNLIPVTIGNIIGGLGVAWVITSGIPKQHSG